MLWLVERPGFTQFVTVVIIVNAITLGLETAPRVMADCAKKGIRTAASSIAA